MYSSLTSRNTDLCTVWLSELGNPPSFQWSQIRDTDTLCEILDVVACEETTAPAVILLCIFVTDAVIWRPDATGVLLPQEQELQVKSCLWWAVGPISAVCGC